MDETPQETMDKFIAATRADLAEFDRRMMRQRRITLWMLIPYGAAGVTIGVGISNTFFAGLTGTGFMLSVGFLFNIGMSWIPPVLTRRSESKK